MFCANDLLAIGLINELTRLGVRVPEDIVVLGYDDIELAASAAVPLTTIRQPRRELGWEAAELALAEMSEGKSHQHRQVVQRPELVIREALNAPAAHGSHPSKPSLKPRTRSLPGRQRLTVER